jgi:hypothetical protein
MKVPNAIAAHPEGGVICNGATKTAGIYVKVPIPKPGLLLLYRKPATATLLFDKGSVLSKR